MAMSMRERTSEVAVLKAIGFNKGLILFLVLTEAVLVAGLGGALGALGCKGFCDVVDISRVHGRLPAVLLRPLERRAPGPGRLAVRSASPAGSFRPSGRPTSRSSTG